MRRGHRLIAVRHQHSLPAAGTSLAGSAINRAILPIRDPAASLSFYQDHLGMQLIGRQHYSTHTSFFLARLSPAVKLEEAHKYVQAGAYGTTLELQFSDAQPPAQ